jgi:hypothetical protein
LVFLTPGSAKTMVVLNNPKSEASDAQELAMEKLKPKPKQDGKTGRFVAGNGGGGRAKGSRNLLGEAFLGELYAHWQDHGKDAIETLYEKHPVEYVKVIASILPKDLNVKVSAVESMTDDELDASIERLLADRENWKKESPSTEH